MHLWKVNTLISMHICTCWSMHLLSHLLSRFSCPVCCFVSDDKQHLYTNSPGCLNQRRRSDCTPAKSDAHLNPASTRCRATFGPPAKRHSNVIVVAGQWWPAFRWVKERTYAHTRLTRLYSESNWELLITKHLICCAVTSENLITLLNSNLWSNKLPLIA